jgi:hypothetical protein
MNKITKDLIENSYDYDPEDGLAMYGAPPAFSAECLVKLVVSECVKVCKDNNAFVAADRIKKHFGVEE